MTRLQLLGGVLVLAALGWLGLIVKGWHHDATVELPRALASIEQLRTAVQGKDSTITALEKSVTAWQALATPADSFDAAVARLDQAAQRLNDRERALANMEARDREKPDCAALLATDIARVCPAIAAGMRDRARGGVPGSTGRGAGAGGAENTR